MNDILKSINLRLNNPFILSFCLSWIFWNWPVVVGLIWYNSTTIEKFGYTDYKDLIHQNANPWKNYVLPAAFAIAYPFAKWFFAWIQTWVGSKEERTIKVVSGKGFIPTSKYLSVINQYDSDILKLSKLIEDESKLLSENSSLKTSVSEKNRKITQMEVTIADRSNQETNFKRLADISILNGQWTLVIQYPDGHALFREEVYIKNGIGFEKEFVSEIGESQLNIHNYICDPFTTMVALELSYKGGSYTYFGGWSDDLAGIRAYDRNSDPGTIITMVKTN